MIYLLDISFMWFNNIGKTWMGIEVVIIWNICALVSWLNANKISLKASKTEFVIFRSPHKRLDFIPYLKITGQRIFPSKSVKYLGVHLDEHLNWKTHVSKTAVKLLSKRANGILSKLCGYIQLKPLLNIYSAFFASQLHYGSQIWGLCDNSVTHRIFIHASEDSSQAHYFQWPEVFLFSSLFSTQNFKVFWFCWTSEHSFCSQIPQQ